MMTRIGLVLSVILLAGLLGGCGSALQRAAADGDVRTVRTLLDQGEDVNYTEGVRDFSPLHLAAEHGHEEIVRLLLDRGANANSKSHTNKVTALDLAAFYGRTKVVQLLLERGARCCERGGLNGTPIEIARRDGYTEIVSLLEQAQVQQAGAARPPASSAASAPPAASGPLSDVDAVPALNEKARANAYAIVIGIETYRDKLPKADFAARDAKLMGEYLTRVMGYQEENVTVLLNDRAAKADVEKYLEKWLPNRVETGSSVFVYYSGHGAPNPKTGDAYLVPYDGDPSFVDETGYSLKRLYANLSKLPAGNVVVMLDSCFSGAGGRSVLGKGMRPMGLSTDTQIPVGGRMAVLAASAGDQVSSTYEQKGHGLLTYYFLKGLRGEADTNKDGSVDLAEVFAYVKPNVERTARREFNNEQTPQLLGSPELLNKGVRLVERPR